MRKGEIAHYEQFLLFPQCFQKACFPGASEGVIVWEWVKYVFSIQGAIRTIKGHNSIFLLELCPFFDLDILSSIKQPTAKRWHLHAALLYFIVLESTLFITLSSFIYSTHFQI